ncbi:MAG: hypothetical protein QM755_03020 [Luteolibacter sp.]
MIRRVMTLCVLLSCAVGAQEVKDGESDKKPGKDAPKPHQLRFLAVGDPPPFVQEVRDGARYEVPPPEGMIPPRALVIPVEPPPAEKKAEPVKLPLKLRLGQMSSLVEMALPDNRLVQLNREGGGRWLEFQVPTTTKTATLVLLCRDARTWDKPRALILPDDAEQRKEGSVHFSNLSATPIALALGNEKLRIDPGKTVTRIMSPGGPAQPLDIRYPSANGSLLPCLTTQLEGSRGGVRRIIIYTADGAKPRSPVKVFQLEESF